MSKTGTVDISDRRRLNNLCIEENGKAEKQKQFTVLP